MYYSYRDCNGNSCVCDIEKLSQNVIIATELKENKGMSITNCVEYLAKNICDRFNIPYNKLVWVEHYNTGSYTTDKCPDSYAVVTFDIINSDFTNPKWKTINKTNIADLIRS